MNRLEKLVRKDEILNKEIQEKKQQAIHQELRSLDKFPISTNINFSYMPEIDDVIGCPLFDNIMLGNIQGLDFFPSHLDLIYRFPESINSYKLLNTYVSQNILYSALHQTLFAKYGRYQDSYDIVKIQKFLNKFGAIVYNKIDEQNELIVSSFSDFDSYFFYEFSWEDLMVYIFSKLFEKEFTKIYIIKISGLSLNISEYNGNSIEINFNKPSYINNNIISVDMNNHCENCIFREICSEESTFVLKGESKYYGEYKQFAQ